MNRRQVAYILGRNAPGIFEIALWMRGLRISFCDMVANEPFAEALLDVICEIKMKYWEHALGLLGKNVMMISEADDLASQNCLLVSPDLPQADQAAAHPAVRLHQTARRHSGENLLSLLRRGLGAYSRSDRVRH